MPSDNYNLVSTSLSYADDMLATFKIDFSPTSLEAIATHIAKHAIAMSMSMSKSDPINLITVIVGLALKLTCDKEARAFLKAEETADATQD
jgi:hypothetical protein